MKHKRTVRLILAAFTLSAGSAFAAQKFDAPLQLFLENPTRAFQLEMAGTSLLKSAGDPVLKVLVRATPEGIEQVRKSGARVTAVLGNIASVQVRASLLRTLVDLPGVEYVEAERKLPQRLNASVPLTRANLLRGGTAPNFTGVTGAGVIVGVIDDGVDFRHLDFRNADGTTRLLGLWDQRETGAVGTAPAPFDYGGLCTVDMLNNGINNTGTACAQPSTGNHGTHVAGIAAGNGQQTGNGQAAYRFVGMAPKADILAANSIGDGVAAGNAVVDAISWMKSVATAVNKPLVVNLSLGSYYGARDGTSNFEQALSNAGGTGVVIVAAAGNEGADAIRALGTISQGETQNVTFNWPATVTGQQKIELWYPGANQYAIQVTGPGGCTTGFHLAGATQSYTNACGTIDITSTAAQASNDDRQILVNFTPANPVAGTQGAWTISLRGDTVATPSTPFSMICGETGSGLLFTSNTTAVTTQILTDTASASRTIGVAAYNSNYNWTSLGGNAYTAGGAGPIGDVSNFSSRGPRRDCSNAVKCPAVAKPEITAPGALIMSALGQDAPVPNDGTTEADGKHVAYNGTSMATPHVAGAIALMLSKNAKLTPEQAKTALFGSVQTNAFTIDLPNIHWGRGILDAQAAYNATPSLNNPVDFNQDGKSDLIWSNTANGATFIWRMNGLVLLQDSLLATIDPIWKVQGVGDFNGDGHNDVVWRHTGNGNSFVWYLVNGALQSDAFLFNLPPEWVIQGVADFNADGKPDFLMRNTVSGNAFAWYFNNNVAIGDQFLFNIAPEWKVEGVADLGGDNQPDLLFRNVNSGLAFAWNTQYAGNTLSLTASSAPIYSIDYVWEVVQLADWNGDGKPDLVFRNKNTGLVFVWYMNGTTLTTSDYMTQIDPSWEIVPRR